MFRLTRDGNTVDVYPEGFILTDSDGQLLDREDTPLSGSEAALLLLTLEYIGWQVELVSA